MKDFHQLKKIYTLYYKTYFSAKKLIKYLAI